MGFAVRQYIVVRIPKEGAEAETLTVNNIADQDFAIATLL